MTKYPRAGGAAVFAERAFKKPLVSFLVGFSMLAAGVTSAAGLSLAFSGDYLSTLVDVPAIPAAIAFLGLVACLNARGISESVKSNVKSNVVMTVVELTGLVIVVVAVAVMLGRGSAVTSHGSRSCRTAPRPRWRSSVVRSSPTRSSVFETWVAVVATTAVAMVLTIVGDLSTPAETVVLLLLVVFISTNVAVLVLVLRRDGVDHEHFQVWTPVPVRGVASCLLLMTQRAAKVCCSQGSCWRSAPSCTSGPDGSQAAEPPHRGRRTKPVQVAHRVFELPAQR